MLWRKTGNGEVCDVSDEWEKKGDSLTKFSGKEFSPPVEDLDFWIIKDDSVMLVKREIVDARGVAAV